MSDARLALKSIVFLVSVAVWAQKPVINPNGVVNAASLVSAPQLGQGLAPGSVATIFGQNLASATASSDRLPLPTTLAGTSVSVQGRPAPLFYVSPGQINFQVPEKTPFAFDGSNYVTVPLIVTTNAGSSEAFTINMTVTTPGVFTLNGSGCGPAAVLNVRPNGDVSLNTPSNSAAPGDFLEIFGTGLGLNLTWPDAFRDGEPAPYVPNQLAASVLLDETIVGFPLLTFTGRAPGLVGVDQINAPIADTVREGCAVPLMVSASGLRSPAVTVSIHRGGGPCVDPPEEAFGEIVWFKETVTTANGTLETDSFSASFPVSPGARVPSAEGSRNATLGPTAYRNSQERAVEAPYCPVPGYRNLDVGNLQIQTADGERLQVPAGTEGERLTYRATLSPGSLRAGAFRVSAAGGNGIGPVDTTIAVGSGIQVTSQFAPGAVKLNRSLSVTWTGGEPGSVVRIRLVSHAFLLDSYLEAQVPAIQGRFTFGTLSGSLNRLPLEYFGNLELIFDVFPDPSKPPAFSAPGLSLGGRHTWLYRYRFPGV